MRGRLLTAAGAVILSVAVGHEAIAGGLYVSDRGVRPLGRGGAFVAGADDLGAIWYNPAGLADTPASLLVDASWLHYTSDFTRQALTTSAQGTTFTTTFPSVSGSTPVLPIPTLAAAFRLGEKKDYTLAFGVYAPYTALTSYPQTITDASGNPQPAPQRYSLISLDGSALVILGTWLGFKPIEELRVGAGVQLLTGTFRSTQVFSACPPDNLFCASENPDYDALAQLKVGPIFAPSFNGGVTWVPSPYVRVGASGQAPFWVSSGGTVDVHLPSAVVFDNAQQQGNQAHVSFVLPPIARIGVEVRPFGERRDLRVELAYVREFWSMHKSIDVVPSGIQLTGVTGLPPLSVAPISIPRGFQDSNSVRLGGEYAFHVTPDYVLQPRIGFAYETSAIPEAYVSPLTIDSNKLTAAIGGGLAIGTHWRFDAVLAHVFAADVTVTPQEAAIPRISPVRGNPTPTVAINGGMYSARADVLGVGLQYTF